MEGLGGSWGWLRPRGSASTAPGLILHPTAPAPGHDLTAPELFSCIPQLQSCSSSSTAPELLLHPTAPELLLSFIPELQPQGSASHGSRAVLLHPMVLCPPLLHPTASELLSFLPWFLTLLSFVPLPSVPTSLAPHPPVLQPWDQQCPCASSGMPLLQPLELLERSWSLGINSVKARAGGAPLAQGLCARCPTSQRLSQRLAKRSEAGPAQEVQSDSQWDSPPSVLFAVGAGLGSRDGNFSPLS